MRELICLLLVGVVSEVMGQTYPLLRHKSIEFSNNSFINRGIISISDPLRCVTDRTPCCGVNAGVWRDPEGAEVREGASGATDFYITRSSEGEINLHRISGGLSGMWLCEIPDSAGDTQRLYIYLGIDTTGALDSAVVSFSSLLTDANEEPPQFILTCVSEGGPATSVVWERESTEIPEDSDHVIGQILVDSGENTVYENTLRVTGREPGQYQCTVSSNRGNIFGETGSTITSDTFTVQVAEEPDRVNAVQLTATSILVTWDRPGMTATGYQIFFNPDVGIIEISEGDVESYAREDLEAGVDYTVSIVALSIHLPSTVSGPITPSTLEAPAVTITQSSSPYVGLQYTLHCMVVIPDGIVVSGDPHIQFEGPNDISAVINDVMGSGNEFSATYTLTLTLTSSGDYTCISTYSVNGGNSVSPEGRRTLMAAVTIQQPTVTVGIDAGEVAYISNNINLVCVVALSGVKADQQVEVELNWKKDGNELPDSDRITVTPTVILTLGVSVSSSIQFMLLELSDSGVYECEAVITPTSGSIPVLNVAQSMTLSIITPIVSVETAPVSLRILDHRDFNQFTITCTASATAADTPLAVQEIVWERRVGDQPFQAVPPSDYNVTNTDSEYISELMGAETDTSAVIQFRCRATLPSVEGSSVTSVTVSGSTPPVMLNSIATDFAQDSVVIQWTVPYIAYTPETYEVIYGAERDNLDRESTESRTSGPDINAVDKTYSLPLTGLQAMTTYYYRIVARNSFDTTDNAVGTFNTTSRTTDPPTDFTVTNEAGSLSYTFSWGPPLELYDTVILSYRVHCTPLLEGVAPVDYKTLDDTIFTATLDLGYGLPYNCCVQASNAGGLSNVTCLIGGPITTPQIRPTGPPLAFQATPGPTNLTLTWDPPSPSDRNGPITGYTLRCSGSSAISLPSSSTSHTLTDLIPNTDYMCSIFASNREGDGPATQLTTSTLEDIPDTAPLGFTHSVENGTSDVMFQWRPPPADTTNGVIIHYTVSCNSSETLTLTPDLSLSVSSLTPATYYSCSVSASTSAGEGPHSNARTVLTVPGTPEGVSVTEQEEEGEEGLVVTWNPVIGLVTGYNVMVERTDRGDMQVFSSSDTLRLVSSQDVGGRERVRVQITAVNTAGYGPPSTPRTSRTPSIAPGPVGVVNVTINSADTATVSWSSPEYPNGILTGYTVSVELYVNDRVIISPVNIENNTTLSTVIDISTLMDGVPYNVLVVAVNEKGSGVRDPLLWFSRELSASVVELAGQPSRTEDGDILLSWTKPSPVEARGIISEYVIEFAEIGGEEGGAEGGRERRQQGCSRESCMLETGEREGCCLVDADQTSVTITGLDPDKDYNVSISAVNGAGVGDTENITVEAIPAIVEDDTEESEEVPYGIIAGVVGGAVVIVALVAVIIVIIVLRRRSQNDRVNLKDCSPSIDEKRKGDVRLSAVNKSTEAMERMRPIELDKFEAHVIEMHQDRDKGFEIEYQTFSTDPVAPCEAAKNVKNKNKNRFANIFPYDHNRVRLLPVDGVEGSDYINASFVDGYSRSNAYIAAQGPMSGTICDFWRMVWEHKPATIVMLTKQVEGGKRKCEVYWPEKVGGVFNAGSGIHIVYKELRPFADYEIKIFSVSHAGMTNVPPLEVHHFQFLSWPDHGVPQFATALIGFIRRLRQHHNPQSYMLVHCSAGVGRTGAFILLDSMLERIMSQSSVNVYEFLTRMRDQRVHMVQTLAQYVFIHDALVELITCGDTSISSAKLRDQIRKMHKIIPEKNITGFTDQFRLLERVSRRPVDGDISDALEPYNRKKNRYPGPDPQDHSTLEVPLPRVPYNMNRIRLRPTGVTGAEYINASFLDGYKQRNAYLATQAPLANTVNDFWRMVWEFKSRAIVMLCQLSEDGQEMSHQYWPTQRGAKQLCGKYTVTLVSEDQLSGAPEVIVRKFEITDDKSTSSFSITHYHVVDWPEQGRVAPQLLIKLIHHLTKLQRNTENKPITVMCNDGMGRTGAFICIHSMLERMNSEGVVDFFQFIKSSRINRPDIVREQEHYILCHDAVAEYLDSFKTYANFNV